MTKNKLWAPSKRFLKYTQDEKTKVENMWKKVKSQLHYTFKNIMFIFCIWKSNKMSRTFFIIFWKKQLLTDCQCSFSLIFTAQINFVTMWVWSILFSPTFFNPQFNEALTQMCTTIGVLDLCVSILIGRHVVLCQQCNRSQVAGCSLVCVIENNQFIFWFVGD